MPEDGEFTARLAPEEVAELYALQGRPELAVPLLERVLAGQPYRFDIRDRLAALAVAVERQGDGSRTRPIPPEALAAADKETERPDRALAVLEALHDRRPGDGALAAWIARLRRLVAAGAIALLTLLPSPSAARTAAVAALPGGEAAAARFATAVLAEELAARGQATAWADPGVAGGCAPGDLACMDRAARAAGADELYLVGVRRAVDTWRLDLTRYTPAAQTLERQEVALIGGDDARAAGVRSRVRRFLAGPGRGGRAGALLIRTEPPGARVYVDDEWAGAAPLIVDGLYTGLHLVRARRRDRSPEERTPMVAPDTLAEVVIPMSAGIDGLATPGGPTLWAAAAAVGLAAAAAVVGVLVTRDQDTLDGLMPAHAGNVERAVEVGDRGRDRAALANALWGAAGAALLGSAGLYGWDWWSAASGPAAEKTGR